MTQSRRSGGTGPQWSDHMLSLNQLLRELRAIEDFDTLFLAASEHYPEEVIGFELRKFRKRELLVLAESLALRN
jgi:hypothetical protein